jgi:hypothetical protein
VKWCTAAGKISAVRHYHKLCGRVKLDPTDCPQLDLVKRGAVRAQGEEGRNEMKLRRPLSWAQLLEARAAGEYWMTVERAMIWYALALTYLLMARRSELTAINERGEVHEESCLRRKSVTFMAQDGRRLEESQLEAATSVSIFFGAAKGDQKHGGVCGEEWRRSGSDEGSHAD